MLFGIWLVLLGLLGASSLVIAKKPEAKVLIAKFSPYQGWMGAISAIWGAWGIISSVLNLGLLAHWPIYWVSWAATSVLLLALGLLLGVGVLSTFIRNAQANERLRRTIVKLAPYQGSLGYVSIALGAWTAVASVLFH